MRSFLSSTNHVQPLHARNARRHSGSPRRPRLPYRGACALAWLYIVQCPLQLHGPHAPRRPNRGPVILSTEEVDCLLDCLPPPRKEEEGEDVEERQQIKTLNSARARLVELQQSLLANAATAGS